MLDEWVCGSSLGTVDRKHLQPLACLPGPLELGAGVL
jgi:hypothetical protein